jgi:hypothetical protein
MYERRRAGSRLINRASVSPLEPSHPLNSNKR